MPGLCFSDGALVSNCAFELFDPGFVECNSTAGIVVQVEQMLKALHIKFRYGSEYINQDILLGYVCRICSRILLC